MQVWRLETEQGYGPFDGSEDFEAVLPDRLWQQYRHAVFQSSAIRQTASVEYEDEIELELKMERMEIQYGRHPVYGVPDRECFERWFPAKFREAYVERGFMVAVYTVDDKLVIPGASVAEIIFVPIGKKEYYDPITLEPKD